jgi:transposase-like protein
MEFKSISDFYEKLPDEEACVSYLEQKRWGGNPTCPHCDSENPYRTKVGFKCSNGDCHKKFSVKVGTIFESSKLPLQKWFVALYMVSTAKKGISSHQLGRQIGVTQKTAWFMLHRIREMLEEEAPEKLGEEKPVEVDETYVGGKESNKHVGKKRVGGDSHLTCDGGHYTPKKPVIGIVERDGNIRLKFIPQGTREHMIKAIYENVHVGSTVYTDEHRAYSQLFNQFNHATVRHSHYQYRKGNAYTNSIENFWSLLKRAVIGVYHHLSAKHFDRYLIEMAARFNTRKMSNSDRFEKFISQCNGRLRYKTLISVVDGKEDFISAGFRYD